ncbi:connectin-like, partial [Vespula maculifrons]
RKEDQKNNPRFVSHIVAGNKLICDCNLAWIWGLRNETKNTKLRDALEELTCFLESNNTATSKINNDDLERSQELEIARNPDTYLADNAKNGNNEDGNSYLAEIVNESYDDSGAEYEDSGLDSNSQPKMQILDGKVFYLKHLFDLKLEDLPCPETTREDLMASEQPSSRHENAPVGSSGSKEDDSECLYKRNKSIKMATKIDERYDDNDDDDDEYKGFRKDKNRTKIYTRILNSRI